jgi:DNA polymerase-3 subunit beta
LNKGVKVSLKRGVLGLSCDNPNLGAAQESLEAAYDGGGLDIGFNARYLLDVLGVVDSEDVVMELSDPLSPCVLRIPSDAGFLAVVMPMRLE